MTIRETYKIFEKTSTSLEKEIDFTRSNVLKIQISGEGVCDIEVYGSLQKADGINYEKMPIIDEKVYEIISNITKSGIYGVYATGFKSLKIVVKNTEDTLVCVANEIVE